MDDKTEDERGCAPTERSGIDDSAVKMTVERAADFGDGHRQLAAERQAGGCCCGHFLHVAATVRSKKLTIKVGRSEQTKQQFFSALNKMRGEKVCYYQNLLPAQCTFMERRERFFSVKKRKRLSNERRKTCEGR